MSTPPKVGFVSLGCPKALVDSEQILTQLRAEGYDIVPTYHDSDLVVVSKEITTPFHFGNIETEDGYIVDVNEKPDLVFEIIAGIYLNSRSHIVFETPEPKVVDYGVYSRVRHPMYLAAILLYIGFWTTTLSLLTLIPLLAVLIGYNYLASAEEHILTEKFGDEYTDYKKRVSKWIPF